MEQRLARGIDQLDAKLFALDAVVQWHGSELSSTHLVSSFIERRPSLLLVSQLGYFLSPQSLFVFTFPIPEV